MDFYNLYPIAYRSPCLNGTISGNCHAHTPHAAATTGPGEQTTRAVPAVDIQAAAGREKGCGGGRDVQVRYLGPETVVRRRQQSIGDPFEVQLTSFEFRCFRADLRPKTKPKTKTLKQFRPKTKMAKTTINCHFRRRKRKRKRISVGLYTKYT